MAAYSGFEEKDFDEVFIVLDKMDKIGLDGVAEELRKAGYGESMVETYMGLYREVTSDLDGIRYLKDKLKDTLKDNTADDLMTIISSVEAAKMANFKLVFDPTLVRGMSYYTGPIFEISIDGFAGSVGGGGRYDEMIGRFTGRIRRHAAFPWDLSGSSCCFWSGIIRCLRRRARRHISLRRA